MLHEPLPQDPPAPEWPPPMTPERAIYVRGALVTTASALLALVLRDLAAPSTDSPSATPARERLIYGALRPLLPRLRVMFLERLSAADPAGLERLMGATSTAIEQILAQAPGEPIDRWRWVWAAGAPMPELVPDAWHGQSD